MSKVTDDRSGVIYALRFRGGDQYRYVGMTVNLKDRLKNHRVNARSGRHEEVYQWMRNLGIDAVEVDILETVVGGTALASAEIRWISKLRADGHPLLNGTDGGFTGPYRKPDYESSEWRAAYRAGMATRRQYRGGKIGEWKAQHPATAEEIEFRAAQLRGVPKSVETRKKMSEAQLVRRERERKEPT